MASFAAAARLCSALLLVSALRLSHAGNLVCTATLFSHSDYFGQPAAQLSLTTEGSSVSAVAPELAGSPASNARRLLTQKDASVGSLHLVCHCTTSNTDLCTDADFRKVTLRLYTRPLSEGGGEVQDVTCSRLEQLQGQQSCATGIRLTRESMRVGAAALLYDLPGFKPSDATVQQLGGDAARSSSSGTSRALRGQQA
ncbi:hypothetical protein HYH03_015624 [Edaphochlamys debaryana]|uniref:Uncharacterized protein n=1 Tax=Edaphochlamys debaryana TaxID=47281 RepID=A0A836BR20_9CHLO|nr:hypothetical protein HYH03_015624 [Edaphochlamys debaryana]|eukprot:KAG2485652.1 hypothetical protein HYH03_015624 [Edaphochlamys debaryana]